MYKGKCRETCVVYQVKCNICGKKYIGNTQNFLKQRIQAYLNDVVKLNNEGKVSDSFAKHFVKHINLPSITAKDVKPMLDVKVLKRMNPIESSKYFGFDRCQLCMEERIEIASLMLIKGLAKMINKNAEIYGACRHKAKFHVYEQVTTINGTDEGISQKKKRNDSIGVTSDA